MPSRLHPIAWITLACAVGSSWQAMHSSAAPRATGQSAGEDLGGKLLDDGLLERLIEYGKQAKPKDGIPAEDQPQLLPNVEELRRMLAPPDERPSGGEDLGQASESPLARISGQMAQASSLIAQQGASGQTRVVQEAIVSELDKLIDELNKQCQQCQGGQGNKPERQQTQKSTPKPGDAKPSNSGGSQAGPQQSQVSSGGGGDAQPGELSEPDMVRELWGQLPERLRQQLLQSTADEFLPKYREELQMYFRRLAEEQSPGDTNP